MQPPWLPPRAATLHRACGSPLGTPAPTKPRPPLLLLLSAPVPPSRIPPSRRQAEVLKGRPDLVPPLPSRQSPLCAGHLGGRCGGPASCHPLAPACRGHAALRQSWDTQARAGHCLRQCKSWDAAPWGAGPWSLSPSLSRARLSPSPGPRPHPRPGDTFAKSPAHSPASG